VADKVESQLNQAVLARTARQEILATSQGAVQDSTQRAA